MAHNKIAVDAFMDNTILLLMGQIYSWRMDFHSSNEQLYKNVLPMGSKSIEFSFFSRVHVVN